MKPLCVIPARLGSQRLLRKNLAPLGGRPMLAWTIEAALASDIFDKVYVSTESEEIAAVARAAGAEVPWLRDQVLAGDTVTNVAVSLDWLDRLAAVGSHHDAIVCLQPSSPLRRGCHIAESWRHFVETGADFLVSVTEIDPHYFHWALTAEDDRYRLWFGDKFLKVRQELPMVHRPNGAIKIARASALRAENTFIGKNLSGYPMPEEASVHVALEFDLRLCEALVRP